MHTFCRLTFFAIVAPLMTFGQAQSYSGPNNLGPFRIDKDVSMQVLLKELGRPTANNGNIVCFKSADGKGFLAITRMVEEYDSRIAGTLVLSSFPNCLDEQVEQAIPNVSKWRTEKQIGLGTTESEVRRAYGRPSRQDKRTGTDYQWIIHGSSKKRRAGISQAELGEKVLVYQGDTKDLRIAEFGIRAGVVVWIVLSMNE